MSRPTAAARPKRAGDDFVRADDNAAKKPRFDPRNPSTLIADAPEHDLILDADVIGRSGPQIKRNAVNIDGYESDSDNDNFNARAERRKRPSDGAAPRRGKSKDDEDDDMFADLEEDVQGGTADGDEDEELAREGKQRRKDVRFMEQGVVEGEVMSSNSGGHVPNDLLLGRKGKGRAQGDLESSSESGSDEERDQLPEEMDDDLAAELGAGGKKKHAPRLDAFNLREEEEEGRFDEAGNYVRKAADPDAANDSWLDGLSRKDMKRAKEAQERREQERRRKAQEADATLTSDLLAALIERLETGETPLEALQRLERGKPKETKVAKVPKWKQKKRKDRMEVDEPTATNGHGTGTADPGDTARRNAVEAITGAADALYSREQHDIYETERELLMRQYRREAGEDWQPVASADNVNGQEGTTQWEYRWSDARDGGENHGPYDSETMKAWNAAGYFGEGVEFRRAGDGQWTRVFDVS